MKGVMSRMSKIRASERSTMLSRSRIAVTGVIAASLVAVSSAPATTPPQGNGLGSFPATCNGEETTLIASKGAAFYVDGQKYVLQSFSLSDGATLIASREWGNRNGLTGGWIKCTGTSPGNPALTFDGIGVSQ
jgi:hypothetical protein